MLSMYLFFGKLDNKVLSLCFNKVRAEKILSPCNYGMIKMCCMSPVSPVFHTVESVKLIIGSKTKTNPQLTESRRGMLEVLLTRTSRNMYSENVFPLPKPVFMALKLHRKQFRRKSILFAMMCQNGLSPELLPVLVN